MKIRKATSDDVVFMMRLERECSTAGHWTEQQYLDLFVVGESGSQRSVLVAEQTAQAGSDTASAGKGTLVGFLVAKHIVDEWELENIVVDPGARGKGIGTCLMEALLSAARETHSRSVFLEVRESNMAARTLYEKLGFRETGRRKSYYAGPLEDAILYSLGLS